MIQVGDQLPQCQLVEFTEDEDNRLGSRVIDVSDLVKGKKIAVLALFRTFTSQFGQRIEAARREEAEEIWCLGGQDPAVIALWSRELKFAKDVRLMSDGNGVYSQALGLSAECAAAGNAASRSSLLVEDGIVKSLNANAAVKIEANNDDRRVTEAA